MKTQVEFLEEALRLKKENPKMDIVFCVACDENLEGASWTGHEISRVEISDWYCDDERIYTDEEEICDLFGDRLYDKNLSEDENMALAEKAVEENMTQKICVFTRAA